MFRVIFFMFAGNFVFGSALLAPLSLTPGSRRRLPSSLFSGSCNANFDEALALLVISSAGPEAEVSRNMKLFDEEFISWISVKASKTDDDDERRDLQGLCSLVENARMRNVVTAVREDMEKNGVMLPGSLTDALQVNTPAKVEDVLQAMKNVQAAGVASGSSDNTDDAKVKDMYRRKSQLERR